MRALAENVSTWTFVILGVLVLLAFMTWPVYSLIKQERDSLAAALILTYVMIVSAAVVLIVFRHPMGAEWNISGFIEDFIEHSFWLLGLAGLGGWVTALAVDDRRLERQAFERSLEKRLKHIEQQLHQQQLREKQELYGSNSDSDTP